MTFLQLIHMEREYFSQTYQNLLTEQSVRLLQGIYICVKDSLHL